MGTSNSGRQANLPIWRDANRLLVDIELAVRRFPCKAKSQLSAGRCPKLAIEE